MTNTQAILGPEDLAESAARAAEGLMLVEHLRDTVSARSQIEDGMAVCTCLAAGHEHHMSPAGSPAEESEVLRIFQSARDEVGLDKVGWHEFASQAEAVREDLTAILEGKAVPTAETIANHRRFFLRLAVSLGL